MTLSRVIIFLAVFVAPLRCYELGALDGYRISVFRVVWLAGLAGFVANQLLSRRDGSGGSLGHLLSALLLLLYGISVLLGLAVSDLSVVAAHRAVARLFGVLVAVSSIVLFATKRSFVNSIRAFLLSAIPVTAVGFHQWVQATWSPTGVITVPFSEYSALAGLETALYERYVYGNYPRLFSTFLEPNYYGLYLCMIVILSVAYVIWAAGSLLPIRLLIVFGTASVVQMILTQSVSSMCALLAGLLVMLSWMLRLWPYRGTRQVGVGSFIGLAVMGSGTLALAWYGGLFEVVLYRLGHRVMAETGDLWGRASYFDRAWAAFSENPFFGVGLGGLLGPGGVSSGHNLFLTILGEQGLAGFVPLLVSISFVFWGLARRAKLSARLGDQTGVATAVGFGSCLVAALVANLVYDSLFSLDIGWILLGMSAAAAWMPLGPELREWAPIESQARAEVNRL